MKIRLFSVCGALLFLCGSGAAEQRRISDVVYGFKDGDGVALTMDVFEPDKPNGTGIVWVVSGGWFSHRSNINEGLAKTFTDRGDTVFEVVHGSQPRYSLKDILPDMNRAVRFIRFHAADYHIEPDRIGISGASAGGHLSLMIGATGGSGDPEAKDPVDRVSSQVQAVACFYPPTDFLNWGETGKEPFDIPMMAIFMPAFAVTKETPKDQKEAIGRQYSPIYAVTAAMPPTLVIQGDADPLVPPQQAQVFMAKLEELKIPHQLIVKHGGGHGWPHSEPEFAAIADWFDKYLAKK